MNRSAERKQFLEDIIVTAVEGGINYWASVKNYNGVSAEVLELDEPDVWHKLDADTVARGIGRLLRGDAHIATRLRQMVITANAKNDAGMIDAELADCIVQAGIFGEIRYS